MAFEPRSKVKQKSAFGRVALDLEPANGVDASDHLFQAARMQHRLAFAVNEQLRLRGTTVSRHMKRVAWAPGLSGERQLRVLRGETSATYADLVFWISQYETVAQVMAEHLMSLAAAPSNEDDSAAKSSPSTEARPSTPPRN